MRTIFSVSVVMVVMMASLTLAGAQAPANTAAAQGQITFTKDVAPILQNKCQVCHRPDTFAPMSLLTYEDVRPWAKAMKEKVITRMMPPWYIDKDVGVRHFKNDVSLSDGEIATIVKWVDSGAPKGNPELIKLGATPLPESELASIEDLPAWLREHATGRPKDLFGHPLREKN